MKKISVLIPVYNEEESLDSLYKSLSTLASQTEDYEFEFLFVNDGSDDATLDIIKRHAAADPRILYINLSRNFGKEIAMLAGFENVSGDAMVILDADMQDPPEIIPRMIKYWEEGYDDVYAKRNSREGESWLKRRTSYLYYRVLQSSTNIPIQVDTGDFRLLDRRCIDALCQLQETQRNTKAMYSWIGYKKKEIIYDRNPRVAGKTKWNYRKLINHAIDGLTSFTTAPLRISAILGIIISFSAFIYLFVIIARAFMGIDYLPGYPSLMAVVLFIGGIQLLSLGVIGEYIGRIFNETKARPRYLIEDTNIRNVRRKN